MKRPSYTTFEGLQTVFTQPKSREEQVKNLISMDILYLSVVIKELIHLIEEDGIEVSGIAKTT